VASSVRWGDWGEKEGDVVCLDRGARGRSAPRHARRDDQREREGPYCSQLNDAVRQPSPSRCPELNSRSLRPPPVVAARLLLCCRPRRRAPSPTRLSLLLSLLRKSTSAAAPMAYCRHLCRARTRMREIWCVGGVWHALGEHVLDLIAAAAPAALLLATKMIDVPLSGPKRQNSSEKGRARSTRGAGGRQTLPTSWPIGAALARAPDSSRRRPGAVLHCRTVDFLKKARS
jgi:hypothetical protein